MHSYKTQAGESIVGIALRRLANEKRWTEIRDMNAEKYPDMVGTDYYPVGTLIVLPMPDLNNISKDGQKLLKSLEVPQSDQDARQRQQAEMIAKRQAEIQENIVWWRKISDQRVNGFNIKETDPMFAKINERYRKTK